MFRNNSLHRTANFGSSLVLPSNICCNFDGNRETDGIKTFIWLAQTGTSNNQENNAIDKLLDTKFLISNNIVCATAPSKCIFQNNWFIIDFITRR